MKRIRFVGLDVHAETIAVAVAEQDGEVRSIGVLPNRCESVRKLVKKLGPVEELQFCYEAWGVIPLRRFRRLTGNLGAPGKSFRAKRLYDVDAGGIGTAKASRISRHAVKSGCAREWGGWGRLSVDGPGQHNPDRSEGPGVKRATACTEVLLSATPLTQSRETRRTQ